MEAIASYLLCMQNGIEPSKENLTRIIMSVCDELNEESISLFVEKIQGMTHEEIMEKGSSLMSAQAPVAASGSSKAQEENAVEEEEEEESEEEEATFDF